MSFQNEHFCGQWFHSDSPLGSYGRFLFQNVNKNVVPLSSWASMEAFWKAGGNKESLPQQITFFVFKGQVFTSELSDWFSGNNFFGMGPFIGSVLFRSEFGQPMSPTMRSFWQGLDQVCCDVGDVVSFFIVERCRKPSSLPPPKTCLSKKETCVIL